MKTWLLLALVATLAACSSAPRSKGAKPGEATIIVPKGEKAPAAVVIPSTPEGKEIAGRLAIKTGSGFLTDVTDLLCVRMGLTREAEVQWAAGALGFVRSCTEQWLLDPRDRHDFTTRLTTWLWDSSRSFMEVHR